MKRRVAAAPGTRTLGIIAAITSSALSGIVAWYLVMVLAGFRQLFDGTLAVLGTVFMILVGIGELAFLLGVPGLLAQGAASRSAAHARNAKVHALLGAAAALGAVVRFAALAPVLARNDLPLLGYWDVVQTVALAVGAALAVGCGAVAVAARRAAAEQHRAATRS